MQRMVCRTFLAIVSLSMCSAAGHAQVPGRPGQSYALTMMEQDRLRAAADDRQKKLLADAEQLLAMAQSLKTSVDAVKKDELSLQVIREADQIEKLAKSVKDRMRQ